MADPGIRDIRDIRDFLKIHQIWRKKDHFYQIEIEWYYKIHIMVASCNYPYTKWDSSVARVSNF